MKQGNFIVAIVENGGELNPGLAAAARTVVGSATGLDPLLTDRTSCGHVGLE